MCWLVAVPVRVWRKSVAASHMDVIWAEVVKEAIVVAPRANLEEFRDKDCK